MLRLRTPAVEFCLKRAAEAEHLAALAEDVRSKAGYRYIADSWRRLARDVKFTEQLNAKLRAEKD